MRRLLLGLGAALGAMTPLAAQAQQATASPEAMEDLRCAMWAAQVSGSTEDEVTERAFGFVLTYFLGRFEGASGLDFERMATMELVLEVGENLDAIGARCAPRMQAIGDRMVAWGEDIQARADQMEREAGE